MLPSHFLYHHHLLYLTCLFYIVETVKLILFLGIKQLNLILINQSRLVAKSI